MSAIPLIDRTYAGIRGFNYVPSTAASIWDMIDRFEPETWDREFGYATRFGTNTIRIWLDHQSWYRNPQHVVESVGRILDIGERHGIRQAGFWTVAIGGSNQDLYYLLEWESLAERETKWAAFAADPEWHAKRAESEKDGPIVATLENLILQPTAFSSVR